MSQSPRLHVALWRFRNASLKSKDISAGRLAAVSHISTAPFPFIAYFFTHGDAAFNAHLIATYF
jgi:hypothetical protein